MPIFVSPGQTIVNAGTVFHTGVGRLHSVQVRATAAGDVVQVYDGLNATGTLIGEATILKKGQHVEIAWPDAYQVATGVFVRAGTGDTLQLVTIDIKTQ